MQPQQESYAPFVKYIKALLRTSSIISYPLSSQYSTVMIYSKHRILTIYHFIKPYPNNYEQTNSSKVINVKVITL